MANLRSLLLVLVVTAAAQSAAADAVILLYHRFGEDSYPSTNIRIEQFEQQLSYLADNDYQVWPLERIVDHLEEGRNLPDKTVAITVDDAYLSIYEEAFPRLRARGWPFTVFVSTEPVDQRLNGFMSWDQMREMARYGASYGNHSVTHRHLIERLPEETDAQWRERMQWELETAQQRLREELQVKENLFAYPYGEFDEPLANLAVEMGYVAFGQHSGPTGLSSDHRALPRFPMAEAYAELSEFRTKVRTLVIPIKEVTPWNPLRSVRDRPRLEITLARTLDRASEMRCYVTGQGLADVEWQDSGKKRVRVQAKQPLPAGRSRYNCTVPTTDGRFYWYSHPWIVVTE